MLTGTMEVECNLDEFAKVLAANGYINDDSCFAGTDIPSMLSVLDTVGDLDSPDSFPDSPYSDEDISKVLEMAQIANSSLLEDTCFTDNLAHSKPLPADTISQHITTPCKTRDPCIGNAVLNESLHNLSGTFSSRVPNRHGYDIMNDAVSLNFHLPEAKENDNLDNNAVQSGSVLPHFSSITKPSYHIDHPHINDQSVNLSTITPIQQQLPGYLTSSTESVAASADQEYPESGNSTTTKQKRKRKSRGYSSNSGKSRKRKTKKSNDPKPQSQPKPKKQKISKDNSKSETASKANVNSEACREVDMPQEDSGFESGDKITTKDMDGGSRTRTSVTESGSEQEIQEEPRALRRSSRTTRNTENYNFRLSSLVKRVQTERRQQEPRQPKDKIKPAPLSKYRRRTANARERDRMKEINDAFDNLKDSLPDVQRDDGKQKITKFTILKHALNYIASLRSMLGYEPLPSALDDDAGSDLSSVRPASVTSSVGEDSCSSPKSGRSTTDANNHDMQDMLSGSLISDQGPSHNHNDETESS